jgi:hypothetical protein
LIGISLGGVSQTVTTAWRTELGTTLLIGFENTTEIPAYFRCPNSFSVLHSADLVTPSSFPLGPATRVARFLRNSPRLLEGNEFETHCLGLGT